jgi:hypothetical protein
MKRLIFLAGILLVVAAAIGCGNSNKTADAGPQVTSGQVDPGSRPTKPNLVGTVEPPRRN